MRKGTQYLSQWLFTKDTLRSPVPALRIGTRSKSTSFGDASKWTSLSTTIAPRTLSIGLSTPSSSFHNCYTASSCSDASSTSASFWHTSSMPSSTPFLLPECHVVLRRNNFFIVYDQSKRIPVFAAETLTKDSLKGEAKRCSKFHEELCIPSAFRSTKSDFQGSGFDRGHLVAAGNNKKSKQCMKQTFTMANIVPQDHDNNGGVWNELEQYCRRLTSKWDAIHVITGHVMKPQKTKDKNGNKTMIVSYQVIGANEVAVPTHLYKVILCQRHLNQKTKDSGQKASKQKDKEAPNQDLGFLRAPPPNYPFPLSREDPISKTMKLRLEAYLIPNRDVGPNKTFKDFRTPLQTIEKYSGLEMFKEWRNWIELK